MLPESLAESSPSELRKELFRSIVLDNYGDSVPLPCSCAPPSDPAQFPTIPPATCAQDAQEYYIFNNTPVVDSRDPSLPLWPYHGLPLPDGGLERVICRITCDRGTTQDFDVAQLVRILYLTTDPSDRTELIEKIQAMYDVGELPFWMQPGERNRVYWSENHMIMWMSSALLLEPVLDLTTYNYTASDSLRKRLMHFLDLKLQYGFYEFFSTNYHPFTLAALLNLIDFSSDVEIQSKSQAVADRLVSEIMLVTNNAGFFFPAAARNFVHRYVEPPFLSLIWIALGTGVPLDNQTAWRYDYVGSFLATSTYNLENIANAWEPIVDIVLSIGHGIAQHKVVHAPLDSRVDRTLFQWSAGGYFTPETVIDTLFLIKSYELKKHDQWEDFGPLFLLPGWKLKFISRMFPGQTRGTSISGTNDIHIYKHHGVVLTTLSNNLAGARSGEQWLWSATCHDIAVYTIAGVTGSCMKPDINAFENTHMPDLQQDGNVALITYRPATGVLLPSKVLTAFAAFIDFEFPTQVALHFPEERFDEVVENERWIMGRKHESYIAVWRHSLDQNDCTPDDDSEDPFLCEPYFYSNPRHGIRGQVWAVVVGNNITHGSFDQFEDVIAEGKVTERHYWTPFIAARSITYKTELQVDGKHLFSSLRGKIRRPT
jgi:hypothetical protein